MSSSIECEADLEEFDEVSEVIREYKSERDEMEKYEGFHRGVISGCRVGEDDEIIVKVLCPDGVEREGVFELVVNGKCEFDSFLNEFELEYGGVERIIGESVGVMCDENARWFLTGPNYKDYKDVEDSLLCNWSFVKSDKGYAETFVSFNLMGGLTVFSLLGILVSFMLSIGVLMLVWLVIPFIMFYSMIRFGERVEFITELE